MQQDLKFPARCAVLSKEEQAQAVGGAPAWAAELADMLWLVWYRAEPVVQYGVVLIQAFIRCVGAAAQIYAYGKIIKNSMGEIKNCMKFFISLR